MNIRARLRRLERTRSTYTPEVVAAAVAAAEGGVLPDDPRLCALVHDLLAAVEAIDAMMTEEDVAEVI